MRLVGIVPHENLATKLSRYLSFKGIPNTVEPKFNALNGEMSYGIWVHDEDKIGEADKILIEFTKNPNDPKFETPSPPPEEASEEPLAPPTFRSKSPLTFFFLSLCSLIFFLNTLQEIPLRKEGLSEQTFLLTPIQALLMYDLPPVFDELEKVIEKYELTDEALTQIPQELKTQLDLLEKAPYWKGAYDWVVHKFKKEDPSSGEGPLFGRICRGEIWRLFTPCILHIDLLHILFNMLWLWYLGRPIEQRIGFFRTLSLTLIAGVVSNTIQYLMSGPFFIGYSGVITALAGFIWMREKVAPWEGYPLNKATILFLLLFIGAIFVLQVVAFCIQIFTSHNFAPNIANTAHIVGALMGIFLARFSYFAQRVRR